MKDMDSAVSQKLRPSQNNLVVFGAVMLAAWLTDQGRPTTDWAMHAAHSNTLRISEQLIRLDAFGFDIRPSGDWFCLQRADGTRNKQLLFVNAKENLMVTIRAVEFKKWPPNSAEPKTAAPTNA